MHMIRSTLFAAWVTAAGLAAQESPKPAAPRVDATKVLQQRLRATAGSESFSFESSWSDLSPLQTPGRRIPAQEGRAVGRVVGDRAFVDLPKVERKLLRCGRATLVQAANEPWRVALDGPALPSGTGFVREPVTMLLALAAIGAEVQDRVIGELDGHAVETFSLVLDGAQAKEFAWSGVIHDSVGRLRSLPQRLELPVNHLDIAVHCDVGSGHVRKVEVRWVTSFVDVRKLLRRGRGAPDDEEDEEEEQPAEKQAKPLAFKGGLPVRDLDDLCVSSSVWILRDHGKAPKIELTDEQRRLLGR